MMDVDATVKVETKVDCFSFCSETKYPKPSPRIFAPLHLPPLNYVRIPPCLPRETETECGSDEIKIVYWRVERATQCDRGWGTLRPGRAEFKTGGTIRI